MRFGITGSTLGLKGFKVTGRTASALTSDWHADLELEKSKVLWRKPMHLDMKAAITIKDTRPFIALLDNARGEHRWIEDLLLVKNLGGHIQLTMDGDSAMLKDATVGSGAVGVQAKGHADDDRREAMLLVLWHSFVGALEMEDDWQQFELGDARARFDAYRPGTTGLPYRAGARTQPADSARKAPPGPGGGRAAAPQPHKGTQGTNIHFWSTTLEPPARPPRRNPPRPRGIATGKGLPNVRTTPAPSPGKRQSDGDDGNPEK